MIAAVKEKYNKRMHNFGIIVLNTLGSVYILNKDNGNTYSADAI